MDERLREDLRLSPRKNYGFYQKQRSALLKASASGDEDAIQKVEAMNDAHPHGIDTWHGRRRKYFWTLFDAENWAEMKEQFGIDTEDYIRQIKAFTMRIRQEPLKPVRPFIIGRQPASTSFKKELAKAGRCRSRRTGKGFQIRSPGQG